MVYHVGRPAMFDGKRFLPETGTPIWKILRSSTVLADCEPEPFTVATWMLKSLILRPGCAVRAAFSCTPSSTVVAMSFPGVLPFIINSFQNEGNPHYKTVTRITGHF